eukprot:scaffold417_cov252-Pinguiococcus_pyrenoidosus.AAC.29
MEQPSFFTDYACASRTKTGSSSDTGSSYHRLSLRDLCPLSLMTRDYPFFSFRCLPRCPVPGPVAQ